jgi:hypothetical protein
MFETALKLADTNVIVRKFIFGSLRKNVRKFSGSCCFPLITATHKPWESLSLVQCPLKKPLLTRHRCLVSQSVNSVSMNVMLGLSNRAQRTRLEPKDLHDSNVPVQLTMTPNIVSLSNFVSAQEFTETSFFTSENKKIGFWTLSIVRIFNRLDTQYTTLGRLHLSPS